MNRANTLPNYDLSPFRRAGTWVAVGVAGLLLAGCAQKSQAENSPPPEGTRKSNEVYHNNGTLTYTLIVPYRDNNGEKERDLNVSERCLNTTKLETIYLDERGGLGEVKIREEPTTCADGKVTPEDFAAPTPVIPPTVEPVSGV